MTRDTMRAMVLTGHGDMNKLVYEQAWPKPEPGPREALIRVHACGLNNTDVNTRTAWYSKGVTESTTGGAFGGANDDDATWGGAPITFPRIQGADVVGVGTDVGPDADPALVGKRVLIDTWLRDWDDPLNLDKTGYYGSECNGGFAEFTTGPKRDVSRRQSFVHIRAKCACIGISSNQDRKLFQHG